jgi:hypothetical protein
LDSANQVLSEFIAAGQVWYVAGPDKRPALLTDMGMSDAGHDGVCLFPGRREALDFLRASDVLPGQFRPRRGAPHPRRPESVGSFVRSCRRYSAYLCLPWPAARGQRFDLFFLEIKQLLAAARQAQAPPGPRRYFDDPHTQPLCRFVFDYQRFRFSDN